MGAMTDAVGINFGTTWRWGGLPLFYGRYGACVVLDAIDYTTVLVWWDGLLPGPRYGVASWGGLGLERYVGVLYVF
jgi:hypothetical protein